ncbi:MAG: (Fe-S)-binding protein [Dermatophilaceae bacterium]
MTEATQGGLVGPGRADPPRRVAVFGTCMGDFAAPGPVLAAVDVLQRLGFDVDLPADQGCCGQPALNSGYPDAARQVVSASLRAFAGYDAVVTTAGSCAAMLVAHARALLPAGDPQADVIDRVWELTQFLVAFGGDVRLRLDATVTYHDACHMTRTLGERSSPRAVLARIAGLRVLEMRGSDTCCGFGGTFCAKFPDLSVAMADVKLDQARATGADYLVSADPGCLMHLQARSLARGLGVRTRHVAELVRDATPAGGR